MADTKGKQLRRLPGEGSVHKRPNGTWCAQIDLGPDINGKRRRRSVYGRTRDDVLDKMKELLRQLGEHGDLPTADMTLAKWMTYWLKNIAYDRVKPATFASYQTAVTQYINPSIGKRPLSRLTTAHVRQMHSYVREQGCNSTTAHNAHACLRAALNDAMREGKVGSNKAALVRAPAKAVSKRNALSFDEARAVLSKADERTGSRWLAAFLLGARQGELLGLRWDYIDLEAGMVDLAWSLQPVRYGHGCVPRDQDPVCDKIARACPEKVLRIPEGFEYQRLDGNLNLCLLRPKSRTSRRVVPLPDALWAALRLHEQQTAVLNPHGLVWTRLDGRPINPKNDWTAWKALLKAAGIKRSVTLHEARHSTATWLADAHVPENVIVDLLGHSDVIVNRSYQHLSPATGRQALNLLGAQLSGSPVAALDA